MLCFSLFKHARAQRFVFLPFTQVVVFVVGGATYEEERDMDELSRATGVSIILGGSTMLNSRSFLADVSQLIKGHSLSAAVPIPAGWKH